MFLEMDHPVSGCLVEEEKGGRREEGDEPGPEHGDAEEHEDGVFEVVERRLLGRIAQRRAIIARLRIGVVAGHELLVLLVIDLTGWILKQSTQPLHDGVQLHDLRFVPGGPEVALCYRRRMRCLVLYPESQVNK